MSLSYYEELLRFAEQSFASNLKTALHKVSINIGSKERVKSLEIGLLHNDNHLLMELFDQRMDKKLNSKLRDKLISYIEKDESLILLHLMRIRGSKMFTQLAEF